MKKSLLVILFQLAILSGHAQVTYHFPHTGGMWGQFEGGFYIPCPGCPAYLIGATYYLHSMGDTVINGTSYIKINSADSTGANLNFAQAIREDNFGNVWVYDFSTNADSLLYDFTVNAGDTVDVYEPWGYPHLSLIVDSVSTIAVNGDFRKAIYFNHYYAGGGCCASGGISTDQLIWIEGIGSTAGLMFPDGNASVIDALEFLTCYKENGTLFFGNQCNVVYTSAEPPDNEFKAVVSPNPTRDNFTLSIHSSNPPGETKLELIDLFGRIVYAEEISSSQNPFITKISVDQLPGGNYFLRLKSEKYSLMQKLVISR